MRLRTTLALAWLASSAAPAATPAADIVPVLDRARKAPGEFAADSLIRLASLETLDKPRRIGLLEEAFRRAGEGKQPLKRRVVITRVAGPARFLARAYGQDLDGLSLQLRAVEAVLPLDPGKAREWALRIPPPQVPQAACSDFQTYDLDRLYAVLGAVSRQAYTAKEAEGGDVLRLLRPQMAALTSPGQAGPVAEMLAGITIGDRDFQSLLEDFQQALRKMTGDDRSFTAAEAGLGAQIEALVHACQRRSISTLPLLEGYRLYLVNHLAGARCADDELLRPLTEGTTVTLMGGVIDPAAPAAIQFFNERLQVSPLLPLTETEVTPSHVAGHAVGLEGCQDAGCKAAAGLYAGLFADDKGAMFTDAQRRTPEWRAALGKFLDAVSQGWKDGAGDAGLRTFTEKCEHYAGALELAREPADKQLVTRAWLGYIEHAGEVRGTPAVWFLPIRQILARARLDPAGMQKAIEDLRRCDDPVIALYLALDAVAPPSTAALLMTL
ncbi:MAG: hypothetical protein ABSH56_01935 [Bryobacteraceae bacterium]